MSRPLRAVVREQPSRHPGLHVTVMSYADGPQFRAYLHTPDWGRLVAVSVAPSPDDAAERADEMLNHALARGVAVSLPRQPSTRLRDEPGDPRAA